MARSLPGPRLARGATLAVLVAVGALLAGCSGEEATPIDPANPPDLAGDGDTTDPSADLAGLVHEFEPTPEMRAAAEQQCLDDPELDEGYVQAVDPDDGRQLAELTVDCSEVRAEP